MERILVGLLLVGVASAQSFWGNDDEDAGATNCPCGWSDRGRIVGGKESKANAYPFMAALAYSDMRPFCGATIMTPRHLITAAHCTNDIKNVRSIRAVVGMHDVRRANQSNALRVSMVVEHPNYDSKNNEANDIAIVVLEKNLVFRSNIGPVCMPHKRANLENSYVLVAGWGLTQHEGQASHVLREVILRVITWGTCERHYPGDLQQPRTQFCTYEKNKDSCQGDSGGPLVVIDGKTGNIVLVGLVSFGRDCASESPAVNTEVAAYMSWINNVVKETSNGALETCSRIS